MASVNELNMEAQKVVLQRIIDEGAKMETNRLLRLAESYAWIAAPGNSHGSQGGT